MNSNIREAVINNFQDESITNLIKTINDSVGQNDETVLPGLGVIFEVLWKSCDNEEKLMLANAISKNIKTLNK